MLFLTNVLQVMFDDLKERKCWNSILLCCYF